MNTVFTILKQVGLTDLLDILIVTYIYYKVYNVISNTRAIQLFKGLLIFFLLLRLSSAAELRMVSFVLENVLTYGLLALVILFQPELRRALEYMGRSKFFNNVFFRAKTRKYTTVTDDIVRALLDLSAQNIGALLVLEGEIGLKDVIETGTELDAEISTALIKNIFTPNTPLHDGAVVIRGERMIAAGCLLPLSNDRNVNRDLGTRHRAALGMSAVSDALILVVSEETGVISAAQNNMLSRFLDEESLIEHIKEFYQPKKDGIFQLERRGE
ncbi:MAG: TIGR00159 family protein [Tissierellia bacterium]|nr:TIGR00159 family protein [Tissierellia bacterium]